MDEKQLIAEIRKYSGKLWLNLADETKMGAGFYDDVSNALARRVGSEDVELTGSLVSLVQKNKLGDTFFLLEHAIRNESEFTRKVALSHVAYNISEYARVQRHPSAKEYAEMWSSINSQVSYSGC